jgi:hypothetical protein
MNIDQAFPSNYLKAADLQGREASVKIDRIEMEKVGEDTKPILYFQGKDRGLVLNKTNATNIKEAHGSDTNNWVGKSVTLFTAWVDFQGRSVEAIRVRPAREFVSGLASTLQQSTASSATEYDDRNTRDLNDEIPF